MSTDSATVVVVASTVVVVVVGGSSTATVVVGGVTVSAAFGPHAANNPMNTTSPTRLIETIIRKTEAPIARFLGGSQCRRGFHRGITIPNAHLLWAEVKGRCEHEGTPTMIIIIGSVSIQPDKRELFLAETNKAVRASRAEDGVSRYELVESVEKPNTFLLIEEYADEAVLASHAESQHMQALGAVLGQVLAGPPDVRQYNVSSVQTPEM